MVCGRIQAQVFDNQSVDQAAYRKGFSTVDHLLSATLILERANEWNVDTWRAAIDFEKALDSVEHRALWQALAQQAVRYEYILLVRKPHMNQTGTVMAGV